MLNQFKFDIPGYAICETLVAVRVAIACDSGEVITLTLAKEVQLDYCVIPYHFHYIPLVVILRCSYLP